MIGILTLGGWLLACTTIDGPALGDNIVVSGGWTRIKQKWVQTVKKAEFWAPLATAVVLQAGDGDRRLSNHLRQHQPLFHSTQQADQASDDLRSLTSLAYVATALAAPINNRAGWLDTKSKLLASELLSVQSTQLVTRSLKSITDRQRPDASNRRSLPSGHSSRASVQARLAIFNTQYLPVTETTKSVMKATFNTLAIGTAWARVEAGKHYPSDVLSGWSLGYLMGELAQVFIDADADQPPPVSAMVSADGWQLVYRTRF